MTKLREVRKAGGSMILTIPKSTGFSVGDWVRFEKDGNNVLLVKVLDADSN